MNLHDDRKLFADAVWANGLSSLYEKELSSLAYKSIPPADSVIESLSSIIKEILLAGIR